MKLTRPARSVIFLFIALLTLLLLFEMFAIRPGSGNVQDPPQRQSLAPAGQLLPDDNLKPEIPDVVVYLPVEPASVDLRQLPPDETEGISKYERWLRGEVGPPKEHRIDPGEVARRKAAALQLRASLNAQEIASGQGLSAPVIGANFDALDVDECCGSGATVPPDPELAAGPNHLVAVVNVAFEVYDKSGVSLVAPRTLGSFFAALGGPNCTGGGPFDPNVLYDEQADRFFLAADGDGNAYCVAVTQTGDPTGAWWLYEFPTNVGGTFFDYPHAGVGLDAIFMGANLFSGTSFAEGRIWAFDKSAMYAGLPAGSVSRTTGGDGTPQPINLHGFSQGTWPTTGPHYVLTDGNFDGAIYRLYSWDDPFGANVLTVEASLNLPSEHGVSVGFPIDSVQAGGDPAGDILANDYRVLDFEFSNGSGWTTMTVSCNPGGGTINCVQWAEIDLASKTLIQAGVFASNGDYRYFPDIAADKCGDAVVGYTKSSSSLFPSVWATGRSNGDPLGTMQAEAEVKAGEITYTAFDINRVPLGLQRWGDYTGMTIDPDGVTFWYLGEYSKNLANPGAKWGTRIGSLTMPGCLPVPDFTLSSNPVTQASCIPDEVSYAIDVDRTGGFTSPVTLSLIGAPPGYSEAFSINPVTPSATSVMTLTNDTSANPGHYDLSVAGISPTSTHTITLGLDLFAGAPVPVQLLSPVDESTQLSLRPEITWTAVTTATGYLLEIASDISFTNIAYSATVSAPAHIPISDLDTNTMYFWRVTASNVCGAGLASPVHSFTTATFICNSPGMSIPDDAPQGITLTMPVSLTGKLLDLDVQLDVSHTWVGDLRFSLSHIESGTGVTLIDRPGVPAISPVGCNGDDISALIDDEGNDGSVETTCLNKPALAGSLTPDPDSLSAFDGGSISGSWQLTVTDNASADTGTVTRWCLIPIVERVYYFPIISGRP